MLWDIFVVVISGFLAGLSGCTFGVLPIIFSKEFYRKELYSEKDPHSGGGVNYFNLWLFFAGLFVVEFLMFFSGSLFLGLKKVQPYILLALSGFLFWKSYLTFFGEGHFSFRSPFRGGPFFEGLFFGMAISPCSLPFQATGLGMSISLGPFLGALLFTLGFLFPLVSVALLVANSKWLIGKYDAFHSKIEFISNGFILFMAYFFLYVGVSSLRVRDVLGANLLFLSLFVWISLLIYFFFVSRVRNFLPSVGIVFLFFFHCLYFRECTCRIQDFHCVFELLVFLVLLIFQWVIAKRENQKK